MYNILFVFWYIYDTQERFREIFQSKQILPFGAETQQPAELYTRKVPGLVTNCVYKYIRYIMFKVIFFIFSNEYIQSIFLIHFKIFILFFLSY